MRWFERENERQTRRKKYGKKEVTNNVLQNNEKRSQIINKLEEWETKDFIML